MLFKVISDTPKPNPGNSEHVVNVFVKFLSQILAMMEFRKQSDTHQKLFTFLQGYGRVRLMTKPSEV